MSHPSIIIIRNNNLFFRNRDFRKVISELEEEVYKYPHILSVVIYSGHFGADENKIETKDQHVYIKKTGADHNTDEYIILFNKFCDSKISPATITNMYNSFRNY